MTRTPHALLLTIGAVLLAAGSPAGAQATEPPSGGALPLSIPEGEVMTCRDAGTPELRAKGMVMREFHVGRPSAGPLRTPPRVVAVAFDSSGAPFLLGDEVSRPQRGGQFVIARFGAAGEIEGAVLEVTVDSARMAAAVVAGDTAAARRARQQSSRPLTEAEHAKARALMAWLWPRRCHPSGPPPAEP